MKVLVIGATGATGRLVVRQLIKRNFEVKVIVRRVTDELKNIIINGRIECVVGNISEYDKNDFENIIEDCGAVISCLGHNITLKGLFGSPRMLVAGTVEKLCGAIQNKKDKSVKFILMNTTANQNKTIKENYSLKERIILSVLSVLLPPHRDNVKAAEYLTNVIGTNNPKLEWSAVRPDTLTDEENESSYEIYASPKRSPIFDSGKTSRINVAHFMTELLLDERLWFKWKYRMPVIYNNENNL